MKAFSSNSFRRKNRQSPSSMMARVPSSDSLHYDSASDSDQQDPEDPSQQEQLTSSVSNFPLLQSSTYLPTRNNNNNNNNNSTSIAIPPPPPPPLPPQQQPTTTTTLAKAGDAQAHPLIELITTRFMVYVVFAAVFVSSCTCWFWYGIQLVKVADSYANPQNTADEVVTKYNNVAGFVNGIIEALLSIFFATFFPVFQVYAHNFKWFPGDDPRTKKSKFKKVTLGILFPLAMIALGNSFSTLQANQKKLDSGHTDPVLLASNLVKTRDNFCTSAYDPGSIALQQQDPAVDDGANLTENWRHVKTLNTTLRTNPVENTVLRTAVLQTTVPFQLRRDVQCIPVRNSTEGITNMRVLEPPQPIYGFALNDWALDLIREEVEPAQDASVWFDFQNYSTIKDDLPISLETALELLVQGKTLFERSLVLSMNASQTGCPNGLTLECFNLTSSLHLLTNITSVAKLAQVTAMGMKMNMPYIATHDMRFNLQKLQLNDTVELQAMTITFRTRKDFSFNEESNDIFFDDVAGKRDLNQLLALTEDEQYKEDDAFVPINAAQECGEKECVFTDYSGFPPPRRSILLTKYHTKCDPSKLAMNLNLSEAQCQSEEPGRAAFVYGFGHAIHGEEIVKFGRDGSSETQAPFIKHARREYTLSFAKLSWKIEPLDHTTDADCHVWHQKPDGTMTKSCRGLVRRLANQQALFVGQDAIPLDEIANSDFWNPVRLVDISLRFFPIQSGIPVTLERLAVSTKYFNQVSWDPTQSFPKDACSPLVDAYIYHTERNHIYLERPLQVMYTSALLYLFQNAPTPKAPHTSGNDHKLLASTNKLLQKQQLSGDVVFKKVFATNTVLGLVSLGICIGVILILAVLVVFLPNETTRLGRQLGPNGRAERFLAVQTEEIYPNFVYKKRFLVGETGEEVRFRDFVIESADLVHIYKERDGKICI